MSASNTPAEFTAPEIEEIADLLPAYEIFSLIAVGGMGAVYHARQKSLDREVAVKILPKQLGADAEFRKSFEKEAKSMAKFNHPNLVGIYDFGEEAGYLYIIMELVHGKSLYYSAYGKTIDPAEAARVMIGVCNGLGAAHANGILHRDIKPANILLDSDASPKIGDFGISRAAGEFEEETCYGTPGYTAPEVMNNPSAIDESTDLFAVGVMLHELLTGKLPEGAYTPASTEVGCDRYFDKIIAKALDPTPTMRYRKAAEMAKDLKKIDKISGKTSPVLLRSTNTARVTQTAHVAPVVMTPQGSSVGRNVAIIIGLLVAIFISWGAYKSVKAGRDAEQAEVEVDKAELLEKQKADRAEKAKMKEAARVVDHKAKPVIPKAKEETPMESLQRLRKSLVSGKRVNLPIGAVKQDGRARFLIEEDMSWHRAQQFCENYGGQLAVFDKPEAMSEFCAKLEPERRIWLGAGTNGEGDWCWIDGTSWNHEIRNTSKSAYVTVDATGVLAPRPATEQCAFYIEWALDGSQKGSLKAQLARMAGSADGKSYPAGTIKHEGHYYLVIEREMDWTDAQRLAISAGGVLAVATDKLENNWLLGFIKTSLTQGGVCWLGGHREANKHWQWLTDEPWKFATWANGQPDVSPSSASACAGSTEEKWLDFQKTDTANALLIEWIPGNKVPKAAIANAPVSSGVKEKRAVCVKMIANLHKKYDKRFKNNLGAFEHAVSGYTRTLTKEHRDALAPPIKDLTESYVENKIPEDVSRDSLSLELSAILNNYLMRQKDIEKKHLNEVNQLRIKYCQSIQKSIKELEAKGLTTIKRAAEAEVVACGEDAHSFIAHIEGGARTQESATAQSTPANVKPVDKSKWGARASVAHKKHWAKEAIDGNRETYWHSGWQTAKPHQKLPHNIDVSFNEELIISGVILTPYGNLGPNSGVTKGFEIYVASESGEWEKVHSAELPNNTQPQRINFGKKIKANKVKFKSLSTHKGVWTSLAEFDIIR